jgi:hypothetical protein
MEDFGFENRKTIVNERILNREERMSPCKEETVMHISRLFLLLIIAGCLFGVLPAWAQPPIGGDQGWYAVHCNVDGAQVFFDSTYEGDIQGGVLYVAAYTTGTPFQTYTVQKDGYSTFTDTVPYVPGKGETLDLYATLNPVQPTQPPVIGGDQGWYTVHCNVNGATVMFDNQVVGVITNGVLTVPVYTTGTPYKTYTVTSPGYTPYTGTIDNVPAAGQTIDLYATLNPAPTTAPTKGPISPFVSIIALAGMALFAALRRH